MRRRDSEAPPTARSGPEALESAIAHACLSADDDGTFARDLRKHLEDHGVLAEDVEAIMAAPRRLVVYRRLVRNGLSAVVLRMLPRTRARMNVACAGRFDADFARFVDEVSPRTHYVRDVPAELFAWAEPRWRADAAVPAYLPDLAAHELAHFAIASSDSSDAMQPAGEVALDRPLAFSGATRLQTYAWAVHELPADEASRDEPERRDVHLLGYRDPSHAVRWLELTPLAAAIVRRLLSGEALGVAIERACAVRGATPAAVLGDIVKLIADLGERGVVLGALVSPDLGPPSVNSRPGPPSVNPHPGPPPVSGEGGGAT